MKYKNLKSVAHNFGHSITSAMNWSGDDYVTTHLARAAIRSGETKLRADLIEGGGAVEHSSRRDTIGATLTQCDPYGIPST